MTKKTLQKIKNNRACPAKLQRSGGFVLLFAVTIAALLLSIALGVSNIAFREVKFNTSAKNSSDAFFAADAGIECAMVNDKSTGSVFVVPSTLPTGMKCLGGNVTASQGSGPIWTFEIAGLGSTNGCAVVTVDKTLILDTNNFIITSKGYNNGGGGSAPGWTCNPSLNTVERLIELKIQA